MDGGAAERRARARRRCLGASLAALIVGVLLDSFALKTRYVITFSVSTLEWVQGAGALGVLAFILFYAVGSLLFFPGVVMTAGGAVAFVGMFGTTLGVVLGTLFIWIGAMLGSTLAFLASRYVLRERCSAWARKRPAFAALNRALSEDREALRLVLLLRLSPIVPYSAFNYVCGVTDVGLRPYVAGGVGMLPGTAVYTFIACTLFTTINDAADGDFGDQSSALRLAMLLVGVVAAIVGIGCIARRARARLDEHLDALDPLDGDGEEEEEAHAATPLQRKELGPQP